MKTTKVLFFSLLIAAMATLPQGAMSQVTIGQDKAPEPFSVLELISNNNKGLRLPQLTTAERDNLTNTQIITATPEIKVLAKGLTIYNFTKNCVEYWNNTEWVGIGCPPPIVNGDPSGPQTFVVGNDPTTIDGGTVTGGDCAGAYTYQWYLCTTTCSDLANWSIIVDATSATYLPPAQPAAGIYTYKREVTCGSESVFSGTVIVTVIPAAPTITPANLGACSNGTVANSIETLLPGYKWYTTATGGTAIASTTSLTSLGASPLTLYASQTVSGVESTDRTAVTVTLVNCSTPSGVGITTFVRVMYDFQHQTLEAYNTGGTALNFEWQVSTGSNYVTIPDAPNSKFYTIPVNFYKNALASSGFLSAQTANVDSLLNFRCVLSNPVNTPATTAVLPIYFINTDGYAKDAQNRKYVTLKRGNTGTMNMLLLNLGQSGDSYANSDAADLGDFYQWGRVADGHQNVVWQKGTDHINTIKPWDTPPANTSTPIAKGSPTYGTNTNFSGSTGQILNTDATYFGKFISYNGDWGNGANDRWGNGSTSRTGTPNANNPAKTANDPCPAGWKVPSYWSWWDLYNGDGSSNTLPTSSNYVGTNNAWQSFIATTNNAIGGNIITSNATDHTGERVFLPATGLRDYDDGTLYDIGTESLYWSSTGIGGSNAYNSTFRNNAVGAGNGNNPRGNGFSVRCVSE
jgi:uncharacterized protein (TIGR02145 family)